MTLRKFFVAALMLVAISSMAQMPNVTNDEAVRTGKLPNGLTYYIRHNEWPEHRVNFYIAQRVGSLQEEESQRGLAHFLEHMAFNGTEHYPGNGVIDYTRTLGVEFGRDLNAYTSVDQTVYNINDVPSTRQSAIDSCLLILKDWSNGLLLEGEEIDKERGVIHEEWRLRSSATQRMLERNLETLYPGSKYGKRMPIGLMSVVDNFKYNEIRDYYHKWYRPDNQAIVVVGDVDVDRIEAKIKEMFGIIPTPGADAAQVVDVEVPDNADPIIVVDKDKEQQMNLVMINFKTVPLPNEIKENIPAYMITKYVINMACTMLDKRLDEKAQDPDCPYMQAGAGYGTYLFSKTKDAFQLNVVPKDGKTNEAVRVVEEEALRAGKFGFTATEYARVKDEYLSNLEKQYNNRNQINNNTLGRQYCANYLENEPYPSIETRYQMMSMLAPQIPVDYINQFMGELVTVSDSNLVVISFNRENVELPGAAELKGAIDQAQETELTAYVDNVKDEPLITNLPKPGKIVKETVNNVLGYKELKLSNGATVIIKKTDFKDDEIQYFAESKGGSSLYGEKDWTNCSMFDAYIGYSGLGNFSSTELQKALAGKNANVDLTLSTSYERLSGNSTKKDLETMFQMNYLYFTNIKKDEKAVGSLRTMLETQLKAKGTVPEMAFSDSIQTTIYNHSWRERPFNAEDLAKVDYDRILQIAKERTANAADFTFYFVGNYDEATLKQYIEQYVASLPGKKGKGENFKDVTEFAKGNVVNEFIRKMETPKCNSLMMWYTTAAPYTLENILKSQIAGDVLETILLQKIREDEGAAYSTSGFGRTQRIGSKTYSQILAVVPMKPEKKEIALKIMRESLGEMTKSIDETTLTKIKERMIKDYDTNAKSNSHWINVINTYKTLNLDTQNGYKELLARITTADISNYVRDVILKSGNHIEVIMLPEE